MQIDFDWLELELDVSLGAAERQAMAEAIEVLFVAEGAPVIHQDATPGALFLLASGSVEMQGRAASGHHVSYGRDNRLKVLGEISFFSCRPTTASVTAAQPCIVYRIGLDGFRKLMQAHPALVMRLFSLIVRNMGDVIAHQDERLRSRRPA